MNIDDDFFFRDIDDDFGDDSFVNYDLLIV